LRERVATFAAICAEKLRNQNSCCHTIIVMLVIDRHTVKTSKYYFNMAVTLPFATNSTLTISTIAIAILKKLLHGNENVKFKKAGVIVTEFIPEDQKQFQLFEEENPKHLALMRSMDFLNKKDKKNDGFFLLVNSAQIALGAKLNNPDYMLSEYNDFDETLAKVLDFAERDKETLVIVTSGYETGGYSVNPGSKREKLQHEFTGNTTTGTLVPVFSQGPGAIKFTGFFENTDFLPRLKALFGWN